MEVVCGSSTQVLRPTLVNVSSDNTICSSEIHPLILQRKIENIWLMQHKRYDVLAYAQLHPGSYPEYILTWILFLAISLVSCYLVLPWLNLILCKCELRLFSYRLYFQILHQLFQTDYLFDRMKYLTQNLKVKIRYKKQVFLII